MGYKEGHEVQDRVQWLVIPGHKESTPTFKGPLAEIRGKYLGGWQQVAIIDVDLSGGPRMRPKLVFKDPSSGYDEPIRSYLFEEIPSRFAVLLEQDQIKLAIDAQFVGKIGIGPKLTLVDTIPRGNLSGMNIPLF